ncbi:MAG: TorF family putative porin [Gammaproteobacteria bacterium]|nr:TorF family putative porin [Gammaproteobacteria bacterium]
MKCSKLAIAIGAAVLSGSALAEFSANIGATSNYLWRGVSQTDDGAAISGGLDYAHDAGFYVGTWASNVDFGDDTTAEVDFYGGFSNEVGGVGYDVGLIYYYYPGCGDCEFTEVYGSLGVGPVTAGVHYTIDSEVDDVAGQADLFQDGDIYYYVGASVEVAPTWTVGATAGYYDFDDDGEGGGRANDINYAHYQLDIGKSAGDFGDFTFTVSTADHESGDGSPKVVASWGKTF